jgi:urease accessory protein
VAERRGDRNVAAELSGTEPWRPRIIASSDLHAAARVALVQSRASILSGDDVELSVRVGEEATLELVELGATLVHDVRDGEPARIAVDLAVEPGGRLTWLGLPLIVAAGADVSRAVSAHVAVGGRLLLGETVVLGRVGQCCGALRARTRISCGGRPMLDEELDTSDIATLSSPVVAGSARAIGSLILAGVRDDDPPAGAMGMHGAATVWRSTGTPLDVQRRRVEVELKWLTTVTQRAAPAPSSGGLRAAVNAGA